MKFCRRSLLRIAVGQPENLALVTAKDLMDLYRGETCDERCQGNCLAELYMRWFVGDAEKLKTVEMFLQGATPGGLPARLLGMRMGQDMLREEEVREAFAAPLWPCDDEAGRTVEHLVRERLRSLLVQVDGFVPVYDATENGVGFFIAFEIIPRGNGRSSPFVVDASGRVVANWNKLACRILGDKWMLRVLYRQSRDVPPLTGRSFLLPLLVAFWKKEGDVPNFHPWHLLFTGDVDAAGRTVPVKTEEKSAGVQAAFQHAVRLVAPSDCPYGEETRGVDPIPSGISGAQLLEVVRSRIEQLAKCRFTVAYARDRLPSLEHEIRQETASEWSKQIARVEAMLRILGRHVAPREYLRLAMLRSAAYCHSGQTGAALRENARALAFAREKGMVYEALRLEIEQLVEFQDSQRFDEIARLVKSLSGRLGKAACGEAQRKDLLMRYHGTMGQIQMEEGLLGVGKGRASQAKKNLEKAHEYARALGSMGDQIQDLNYLHLWYALFDPENEELVELDREIGSLVPLLESEGERCKNMAFFRRQRAVAAFMTWRRTGDVPLGWEELKAPPHGSETWLTASFMKMKGALAASAGNADVARNCFDVGNTAFPLKNWWAAEGDVLSCGPVFAQIRLALLVQACCSLEELGLHGEAEDYRWQALGLFRACPALTRRIGAEVCRKALEEGKTLPPARSLPVFYH